MFQPEITPLSRYVTLLSRYVTLTRHAGGPGFDFDPRWWQFPVTDRKSQVGSPVVVFSSHGSLRSHYALQASYLYQLHAAMIATFRSQLTLYVG